MNDNEQRWTEHPPGRMATVWSAVVRRGRSLARRRFTVMVIPHSAKPARAARVNLVSLLFLILLGATVVTSFIYLSLNVGPPRRLTPESANELRGVEASLETARAEIGELNDAIGEFERTIGTLLSAGKTVSGESDSGSLSELLGVLRESEAGDFSVASLRDSSEILRSVLAPLGSFGEALELQRQVVSDLPMLWPIINGLGRMTMEFGPNVHPIAKIWYMHKGVDIAYIHGTPVLATGNGIVTDAGFDTASGYGGYVEIAHPYGFSTKYTHLGTVRAVAGDTVRQGDTIGLLGSTGISTGPHVHYEVTVGTEVIDPAPLLKIDRPDFVRRVDNRS